MMNAEVDVDGKRVDAVSDGFRRIDDHIFGNNSVQPDIAITDLEQQQESQKIVMTAPVQEQLIDRSWQISFVMPSKYIIDSLHDPNNDRVRLTKISE